MIILSLCLIFAGGAFFSMYAYTGQNLYAFLMAAASLILICNVAASMKRGVNDLVIKKLCYIYAFMDMMPESVVAKQIRRVLKEIALDTCGLGYYSIWLKWEAYFKEELKKNMEEK